VRPREGEAWEGAIEGDPPRVGVAASTGEQQIRASSVAPDVDVPLAHVAGATPFIRAVIRDADDFVVAAFEAHRDELFTYLARTTRDDAEAEDLVQEAFMRLAREARAGRMPDQVRAWLYRVASNLAMSRFRRRSVVGRFLGRFGASEVMGEMSSPETTTLRRERTAAMERALRALPEEARLALTLAGEGFSGHEIAEAIGRSEAATRTLMCRARMRLRADLALEDA
jgi:RNA polymerase sigma-70 factor, ECF subfamily